MALTQLTTDLNIIQALDDRPNDDGGLTAAQLKAKFDLAGNTIKIFINSTLIGELESTTDGSSGADQIRATAISGLSGTTIQALLESLNNKIGIVNPLAGFYVVTDPTYGATADGVTNDTAAIQSAIDACSTAGGGTVFLPPGTYIINGTLNIPGNVTFSGAGKGVTTLKRTAEGDIIHVLTLSTKNDIVIEGITFEMNNQTNSTGIYLSYVDGVIIRECQFYNMDHWGIWLGVLDGTDTEIRNKNVLIENCDFENSSLTYEHILVFNSQHVTIRNANIKTGSSSNGIGIYQNVDDITIENPVIADVSNGIYYSQSTNNITITNPYISGCTTGIQGANQSDNGAFGATKVNGLKIKGGILQQNTAALQLGAVKGGLIEGVTFEYNEENAIIIFEGNSPVSSNSSDLVIKSCIIRNNNTGGTSSILHPGILFSSGSAMYTVISDCIFYDDQGSPTQLYPISFVNAQTYTDVLITNCRLSSYSGAYSVGADGSATISTNVQIIYGMDVSGTNATGVVVVS